MDAAAETIEQNVNEVRAEANDIKDALKEKSAQILGRHPRRSCYPSLVVG